MMNRFFALVLALLFASVSVTSACASPAELVHFTLQQERGDPSRIHAGLRDETRDRHQDSWSSGFKPSELIGLDILGFRSAGTHPVRFAIVREAGRLDCAGNGGASYATGECSFTPDAAFAQLLESRGIGRPTRDQAFGLMAVNARREIVDVIAAAHYPTPNIDNLMAFAAIGVTGPYIENLARAGYRPNSLDTLLQFRALNITPEWIGGLARIGYANLPADELVQLRALNISPEFIAGFDRAGYRHLPVDTLVQLKALNITPEFVRSAVGQRSAMPPVDELVQLKLFGPKGRP